MTHETANQWRTIDDSAPKDEMLIIYRPDRIGGGGRVCVGKFDPDTYARRPRPFWRSYFGGLGVQYNRDNPPTHWQPMPRPPQENDDE